MFSAIWLNTFRVVPRIPCKSNLWNVALANLPYNGCIEQGFIGIHTDDAIKILYAGQSEGETGWIYAEKIQPPNQAGWLPIACVTRPRSWQAGIPTVNQDPVQTFLMNEQDLIPESFII